MRIKRFKLPEVVQTTIEKFAEDNDLLMEVHERSDIPGDPFRYYAYFENCEILEGTMLRSSFGDGATEQEAIDNYGKKISETIIIINAYKPSRRHIRVPVLSKRKVGK